MLRKRDPKLLYRKTDAGDMSDVVGIDIPWSEPQQPDLTIDTQDSEPSNEMARRVFDAIPG